MLFSHSSQILAVLSIGALLERKKYADCRKTGGGNCRDKTDIPAIPPPASCPDSPPFLHICIRIIPLYRSSAWSGPRSLGCRSWRCWCRGRNSLPSPSSFRYRTYNISHAPYPASSGTSLPPSPYRTRVLPWRAAPAVLRAPW